jgi:dTDP-4-dehydrorhamnose reductase
MRKKLLVTGFNGFVAGSVIVHARGEWEVHGIDLVESPENGPYIYYHTLDLLDENKLTGLFSEIAPDAVIHTAAMANIDLCQNNKEKAWRINVGITGIIARLCKESGSKMILCSTDSVFDGTKGKYRETDVPNAVNFYAETKIEAEKIVLAASGENVVARLSLVMGLPVLGKGNSFLADTIEKLNKGIQISFPANEIRNPIDVITLGRALVELAGNQYGGIIHLCGNTRINRYQLAKEIAVNLGYSPEMILVTDSNAMEGRAPRPNDASMDNSLAKKILKIPMISLSEGLALTLNFKI